MTLHARSDVVSVSVPVESGGCGQAHIRPVINGAPAKDWVLDCFACEQFLRADIAASGNKKLRTVNENAGMKLADRYVGLWGSTVNTVPETPDEEKKREFDEQASVTKNAASTAEAFAEIGNALKGNQQLMGKFMELQAALLAQQLQPREISSAEIPETVLVHDGYNSRSCQDCGTDIIRAEGQKGALPIRCPDCRQAARRASNKAYADRKSGKVA